MKILFLHNCFYPNIVGGAEVVLRSQAILLQEAGHEVAIATLSLVPGVHEDVYDNIRVFRCGHRNIFLHNRERRSTWKRSLWHALDRYNPLTRSVLREVLEIYRPDIVWCHNVTGWSISAWDEFESAGVPVVQVLHDQYFLCANSNMYRDGLNCSNPCIRCKILRLGHRNASRKVSAVVGVSKFVLTKVCNGPRFEDVPVREVLYNVKVGGLPQQVERDVSDGLFRIGFIGNLHPNKGIKELLETFINIPGDNLRLLVAGNGVSDYVETLKRISTFDSRVTFVGFQSPSTFFPEIDLAVVPSNWQDTLPTVVFEAHGFGVPVLGSVRGGIPEMIIPGFNGDLFDPDRVGDLASKLRSLIESPLWDRIAIRNSAEKFYDCGPWLDKFLEISQKVLVQFANKQSQTRYASAVR